MIHIGFTGSREIEPTSAGLLIARILAKCALMATEGFTVHVGDAPGVDSIVVEQVTPCYPLVIYGINGKYRNWDIDRWTDYTFNVTLAGLSKQDWKTGYLARDRMLVDQIDVLYALWNGTSRGTKYTYDYAVKVGKRAHLFTLNEEGYKSA